MLPCCCCVLFCLGGLQQRQTMTTTWCATLCFPFWTWDHSSLLAEQLGAVCCLSITETCVVVGRCLLAQLLIADIITPNLSWPGLRGHWPPTAFLVTVAWYTVCALITHHAVNILLRTRCLPVQCTPPGLIYARAGEMRAHNKVLVLQVRYPQVATGSRWYAWCSREYALPCINGTGRLRKASTGKQLHSS